MSISVLQLLIVLCVLAAGRGEDWLRRQRCVRESGIVAQTHTLLVLCLFGF